MVLVNMGADHHINMVQAPALQLLNQRRPLRQLRGKLLCLSAASVNQHHKGSLGMARIRTFHQDSLPIAYV